MARNRMIKPDFWSSLILNSVSRDSRLTFIGLWNFCDDYGFCLRSTRSILGDLFPYDESVTEAKLKAWINELIEAKLIIPVDYKTKMLLFVKGWGEHQTVANKSKRSHIENDDLEDVIKETLDTNEILISNYLLSHAPKRKKKEKEESNKEKGSLVDRKKIFADEVNEVWVRFGGASYLPQSEIQTFYNWYSETNKDDEMKKETYEFFEVGKRLATWKKKYDNDNRNKPTGSTRV